MEITKKQKRKAEIIAKAFYKKHRKFIDYRLVISEALFLICDWKHLGKIRGDEIKYINSCLPLRLIDLLRKENAHRIRFLDITLGDRLIDQISDDDKLRCKPRNLSRENDLISSTNIDCELDFRKGVEKLSPGAKRLVDMIFEDDPNINVFTTPGIIEAGTKAGIKKTHCNKAVKEIKQMLRGL